MSTEANTAAKNVYTDTVLLPKTDFPMRAELPKREPKIIEFWNSMELYRKMLEKRANKPSYILHDGPPYANGEIHIGTALNKILKDITVKSRAMMGYYAPYRPGWDCHGLPIEQQLLKEMKITHKRHITDIPAFRLKARDFASRFLNLQREGFKRLGIQGQWDDPYRTMSNDYEGAIVSAFLTLLKKGYIYRGKKTVYWCATCETALADAEVEYADKTSSSIYVKFRMDDTSLFGAAVKDGKPVSIVIWTTTPWTLPANMAAAVAKDEEYVLLRDSSNGEYYVVAEKLSDAFMKACGLSCTKEFHLPGEKLVGQKYRHPFSNRLNPVIHTDFVAMDTGVGVVHIAPGHGEDDFYAGLKWGLEIFCPVDEHGRFTKDAGDEFAGQNIFDANPKVVEKLRAEGKLLAAVDIQHSYPHCWRCKKPIIFRATEQWFLGVDKHGLRKKAVSEIEGAKWVPASGIERIKSMVERRPDWCLSRQRCWGAPVPVIYCADCGETQIDDSLFSAIENRVFKEGSDFWFRDPVEKIVPAGYKCSKCGSTHFRKETDILDVWLDSGVSWLAVLKNQETHSRPMYPADLYLEGSDQHRGWFQTSLLASTALEGKAPFKTVVTHGFVVDEHGRAMHKSAGNAVAPQEVIKKYGAEILRLWVALSDYSDDVRISDKLLETPIDSYRKIRNTVRYLLGNVWDYDPEQHAVPYDKLLEMDRYMLGELRKMAGAAEKHYGDFHYRAAIKTVADFCILDLSAFYLDALKDRLYTLGAESHERRSAQTVLYEITLAVLKLMAPVLAFTAEEAWQELRRLSGGKKLEESVFLEDFPAADSYRAADQLVEKWEKIRSLRATALKALEEARQKGVIGASLEAQVVFAASGDTEKFISSTLELWPSILIVSDVRLAKAVGTELEVKVSHAEGSKCPRCWQWKTDIGASPKYAQVCARCAKVLESESR